MDTTVLSLLLFGGFMWWLYHSEQKAKVKRERQIHERELENLRAHLSYTQEQLKDKQTNKNSD